MYFSSTGAGTGVGGWNMIIHYDDTARVVVIHYELSCSSFPTDPFRYVTTPPPPHPPPSALINKQMSKHAGGSSSTTLGQSTKIL